jgi:hypothetical protein
MAPSRARAALLFTVASIIVVGATLAPNAARSLPTRDDAIVARVPARATDAAVRELSLLSTRLAESPRDVPTATTLARLAITEARRRADPHFLSRAQAALAPWWREDAPPVEVLLLRATIEQARHDFDAALADLDRLVARAPDHQQGHLTRAVVLTVRARYAEASTSCDALADPLVAAVCRAPIDAATGHAGAAIERLVARLSSARPSEAAWALSALGELLYWRGDGASGALARALALDPGDSYTRAVLADLLLDEGRPAEAARLLAGFEHDDALLLRLAIAEKRGAGRRAAALADELRGRFASERARGDAVHVREEARFALEIEGDATRALTLARQSWQVQREPWDARLVLAAARAAGTTEATMAAFVAARGDGWRRAGAAR